MHMSVTVAKLLYSASHELFAKVLFRSKSTRSDVDVNAELPQLSERGKSNFSELQVCTYIAMCCTVIHIHI